MNNMIVLVGPICAGKGESVKFLEGKGYKPFIFSDSLKKAFHSTTFERDFPNTEYPVSRGTIYETVTTARLISPTVDVFARVVVDEINNLQERERLQFVFDGLRHPEEVTYVKEHLGAMVIGLTAADEVRESRYKTRQKEMDTAGKDTFREVDLRDRGIGQPAYGTRVDDCMELADIIVTNNGTLADLHFGLDNALLHLGLEGQSRQTEGQPWFDRFRRL
ncbi:MAG: hypothetical protein H0W89_05055 [Candidatus Levybacteria bacterium]|nr:hypothetical protein [Candidatus Levybacteria bacterium]